MDKATKAMGLFKNGCNCCQAVFCAFPEETSLSEEEALRLSAGFGGGMGRMREVCGAVSGMIMVLSEKFATADPNDHEKKKALYSLIQQAAGDFKAENGSIVCRELLGLEEKISDPSPEKRTETYYKKRPCAELVYCAAQIAAKYLDNNDK